MTDEGTHTPPRQSRGPDEVPLALAPDEFRSAGYAMVDRIADLLGEMPKRSITPGEGPDTVRRKLDSSATLPECGTPAAQVLENAADLLIDNSLFNGHPSFWGYITASPAPIGMLGDLLAAALNQNMGAWTLSPMASEIEGQTVRWIAELIGYPTDCGGLLVSGGNMANFVGLLAARAQAGAVWRVRETGMNAPDASKLRVYVSGETHTWIQKATDLSGMGTDSVRWLPTDDDLRMDVRALEAAVAEDRAAGLTPLMVVGTAGSVSTGAVDPLPEIAAFCKEQRIWFHVDGAYGGFAAAVPEAPDDIRGLSEADSVAIDPHKWLYAPLEAGCVLVRDADALREAFSYHPPYYFFDVEATNYVDFGPQNSRGFRALKVWLGLQQAGREGYQRMIAQDMALARHLHAAVTSCDELEPVVAGLSISVFRYVPAELADRVGEDETETYLNELNQGIQSRLERDGEVFVSNAVIGGKYALRACIVNFNTTVTEIDALPDVVRRVGRHVYRKTLTQ
jgi:aromatic-L-amino-acid/L-tryptophan decarboxylase